MNYLSTKFPELAFLFEAMDKTSDTTTASPDAIGSNDSLHNFTSFMFEDVPVRECLIHGVEWWIAKDVCDALEIKRSRDAVSDFPSNEKGAVLIRTLGGPQKMLCINEAGLYRLIFRARKERAEVFKTWVFETVLPQIRKTGSFMSDRERMALQSERDTYKRLWVDARLEIKRYENRGFLTWEGKREILILLANKYPISKIQRITKKGYKRIKDFRDEIFRMNDDEYEKFFAKLETVTDDVMIAASRGKGGAV